MTVQELTVVHQRYIDLSDRFRAAWTFHQFLQGLQKIFLESAPGRYPADFQGLYNTLKDVSQNLNASEIVRACAISRFVAPVATSRRISYSVSDRAASGALSIGAGEGGIRRL